MARSRALISALKTALYRRPNDELQRLQRWGARSYFRISAWQRQMQLAARSLPLLPDPGPAAGKPLEVWYLTGHRFWYQTAFCAWSLAKFAERSFVLNLVDDGTLHPDEEKQLRRLFPLGVTRWKVALATELEQQLPINLFPILHKRWKDYINIRKLTDIHLGSSGTKLVLDSDMLFFRKPNELLAWWDQPDGPCLMVDCAESYGYSRELMEELVGDPILNLLNVGICGLDSDMINWVEVEDWCQILYEREGTSYYLEQALVAMLVARSSPNVMPRNSYITFPTRQQTLAGEGVLQHYVSDSKPWYFREAWRLIFRP